MRRKIQIALGALAGLLVVLLLVASVWVYTGGVDRWLASRIEATLAEMHVRGEVGELRLGLRAGTFAARDVALFVEGDTEPFFSAESISAAFDYTILWDRRAELRDLTLVRPRIAVRFDDQGRTSLSRIELPDRDEEGGGRFSYASAKVRVEDGEVVYSDEVRRFAGSLDNLAVDVFSKTGGEDVVRRVEASFSESTLAVDGRELPHIALRLGADVSREGAIVETLSIETPAGSARLAGRIENWKSPRYELDAGMALSVGRVAALLDPESGYMGTATLDGKITGEGERYEFVGDLTADDLFVTNMRATGLTLSGRLDGRSQEVALEGRLGADRLSALGADVAGVRFDGRATSDVGRGEGSLDGTVTVARARVEGYTAADVRFSGRVDASESEVSGKGRARIARVVGDGVDATDVLFDGSFGGRSAGDLRIGAVAVRAVRAGDVRARVRAEGGEVRVEGLAARLYDGTVTGSARFRLAGGGASSFTAEFSGINVDKAAGAATPDAPHVNGLASGRVDLAWPGANLQAATGTVTATVDGSLPTEEGAPLPLDGDVALTALPGRFRVDRAVLTSGTSSVTATGSIAWNRTADLDVVATADDASNLHALVAAANPVVARQIAENGVAIGGDFRFEGRVTGPIVSPTVDGSVRVGSVAYEGTNLGAFTATIARAGSVFRLRDARLAQPGGGEIAFSLALPGDESGPLHVVARLDRVDLAPFLGPDATLSGGRTFGTVDVRLLPANPDAPPRTGFAAQMALLARLRGPVDLAIKGARVGGEPVEDVTVKAELVDEGIRLAGLRLASTHGAVDVTGTFRDIVDSGVFRYDLTAKASDVDLSLLRAADGTGPAVAGRASGEVTLEGTGQQPFTKLTGEVFGRDVVVNGEAVSDARLAVSTADGIATLHLTGAIRGESRDLAATIDITSAELPFAAEVDLADTEVMRHYVALVAPPPNGVTAVATGRLTVSGFLGDALDGTGLATRTSVGARLGKLVLGVAVPEAGRTYQLANVGEVVVSTSDGAIRIAPTKFTGEGTSLEVGGSLALAEGGTSNLRVSGDVNLALLTSFTSTAFATGTATLEASVAGTAAAPRFTGFADVRDASLRVVDVPVSLYNGAGRVLFTANQALIESFHAQSGGGTLTVGGGVIFAGLSPDRWRFELAADRVNLNYPAGTQSVVDGDLVLFGDARAQVLSGQVTVRRAEYVEDVDLNDLIAIGRSGSFTRGEALGGGPSSPVRLDLRVEARDSLVVRNNLADAVGSASLTLTGPVNDPIVDGRANVTRGTLQFRQGEYQVTRGVVRFPGRQGGDISFDVQAESDIKGYRVTVGFTGTLERFYPTFSSDPALPQTQVISLVLTGDLGDPNAPVTAQTITQTGVSVAGSLLSEAVSRSVEARTERLFGINRFQIDPQLVGGSDPSARLTVGRRVNKNLSITYSTNINSTDEQVIQLEYRISDRFSFVAAREDDGSYGLDFRVRKRF